MPRGVKLRLRDAALQVIPALDIRAGRCVRLLQGDFDKETIYSEDPLAVVDAYSAAGARRVHVVDLDAARGSGDNRALIKELVERFPVELQVAGGVRVEADVASWLRAGAAAVVMGTVAVRHPDTLAACAASHPGRVLAALDVKAGRPAVTGWTESGAQGVERVVANWDELPLAAVVLTSVDRDGTLLGPDLEMLGEVKRLSSHPIIYSGGIATLTDLRSLAEAGTAGAIVGKALYEGRFDLASALAAAG